MSLTLASQPSRSYSVPVIVAAFILAAAISAAFYFNPHRTGELRATHTDIFAPQTEFKAPSVSAGGGMHVVGLPPQIEKDLYVVVTLHLQDDLRLPLFIDEVDGSFISADGHRMDAVAPAAADLHRLQDIFPQLKALMPHPLLLGDAVPPKSAVDGQVVLHFGGLGESDWKSRRPSSLTVHFAHQAPMVVTVP